MNSIQSHQSIDKQSPRVFRVYIEDNGYPRSQRRKSFMYKMFSSFIFQKQWLDKSNLHKRRMASDTININPNSMSTF